MFNCPDSFSNRFITAGDYRTHYLEAGENGADPLLLVHGSSCEIGMGLDRWYPTIIPLSKHFHVYAVDELGHGDTDPPKNLRDLGHVRVRADHVISFIEARERVDASGLFVLPGMVDGHVHFSQEEVLKYGPLRKFTPPARSRAEAEGLWQRLMAGEICWHPRERWLPSPV